MAKSNEELAVAINAIKQIYENTFGEKLSDGGLFVLLLERKVELRGKFIKSYFSGLSEKDVVKAMEVINYPADIKQNVEPEVASAPPKGGGSRSKGKAR